LGSAKESFRSRAGAGAATDEKAPAAPASIVEMSDVGPAEKADTDTLEKSANVASAILCCVKVSVLAIRGARNAAADIRESRRLPWKNDVNTTSQSGARVPLLPSCPPTVSHVASLDPGIISFNYCVQSMTVAKISVQLPRSVSQAPRGNVAGEADR
jgi:hypothetical protein